MKIYLNKKEIDADGLASLAELLTREKLAGPGMAVAIGDKVIRRADWADTALTDGMKITVISAVCGG